MDLWKAHENQVRRIVISYIRMGYFHPDEFEDLFHEGWIAFNRIKEKYDPNRNFNTLVHFTITNAMKTIRNIREHQRSLATMVSADEIIENRIGRGEGMNPPSFLLDSSKSADRLIEMIDFADHLSDDGRDLLLFLFGNREKVFEKASSLAPKYLRSALIYLLRRNEWKDTKIFAGLRSIKKAMATLY
jgi:RNA polymerase sigma factor (sigma-70 family)